MAFITGLLLIDAPASALNMGEGKDITAQVKTIVSDGLSYPYASAQAYRRWLRDTLERDPNWRESVVTTAGAGKKQQAFTEGDPIQYDDDDLFGYMRAEKGENTLTRMAPFRTTPMIAIAPTQIVTDFGVMSRFDRQEGGKEGVLLHQHEFYRATLKGLFSLDLQMSGTFTYRRRTGYLNLNDDGRQRAEAAGLTHLEAEQAYRLPLNERIRRVQALLSAMGRVSGGAKQTLHYTDVTPAFVIAAVTKGGNNIFARVIKADGEKPFLHDGALNEIQNTFSDDLLSGIYVGRAQGFMDNDPSAELLESMVGYPLPHPRTALDALANDLVAHSEWLE